MATTRLISQLISITQSKAIMIAVSLIKLSAETISSQLATPTYSKETKMAQLMLLSL